MFADVKGHMLIPTFGCIHSFRSLKKRREAVVRVSRPTNRDALKWTVILGVLLERAECVGIVVNAWETETVLKVVNR